MITSSIEHSKRFITKTYIFINKICFQIAEKENKKALRKQKREMRKKQMNEYDSDSSDSDPSSDSDFSESDNPEWQELKEKTNDLKNLRKKTYETRHRKRQEEKRGKPKQKLGQKPDSKKG